MLSRLRPLIKPPQNPQNHRIHQPTNRPQNPEFASARHPAKKLKKVEISRKKSLFSILIFSVLKEISGAIRLSGLPAEIAHFECENAAGESIVFLVGFGERAGTCAFCSACFFHRPELQE